MRTTSLIGRRCKHSNVFSRPVLITRGLDLCNMQTQCPAPTSTQTPIVQSSGRTRPEKVGGYYIGGPPVPIPNTAVKPDCAEDTCLETDRKNRSLPTSLNPELKSSGFFLYTVRYAIMTARQNLEVSYYEIGRLWTIC